MTNSNGISIVQAHSRQEALEFMETLEAPVIICRVSTQTALWGKLRELQYGIFDFDGTLAHGPSHWLMLSEYFDDQMRDEVASDRELFAQGRPADSGLIDSPWQEREVAMGKNLLAVMMRDLERIRRARLSSRDLHDLATKMRVRQGAAELLQMFDSPGIVSAGIRPVIAEVCRLNGLEATISALDFVYDDAGHVVDYPFVDVIHDGNKGEAALVYLRSLIRDDQEDNMFRVVERSLIVGDSIYDRNMFLPRAVNALIVPSDDGVVRGNALIPDIWEKLTFVYKADDFLPLIELIKQARESRPR